jgi:hypothetical protein
MVSSATSGEETTWTEGAIASIATRALPAQRGPVAPKI